MPARVCTNPVQLLAFVALALCPFGATAPEVPKLCTPMGSDDRLRPIPKALAPAAQSLFGVEMPAEMIEKGTVFRCMDGKIWLCNSGANLNCNKANVTRQLPGAANWCHENPNAATVPAAATGRDTIYNWTCSGTLARISKQAFHVDRRGYIRENWRRLP
jgi:hypothetical protein